MSQSNDDLEDSFKKMSDSEKDEIRVSESKKVRLEDDRDSLSALEADNKRLNSELRVTRESKERMETKCEALENERVRLEGELGEYLRFILHRVLYACLSLFPKLLKNNFSIIYFY